MHVVIIGAGEVGGYLAERLSAEGLDVVVIEVDPVRAAAEIYFGTTPDRLSWPQSALLASLIALLATIPPNPAECACRTCRFAFLPRCNHQYFDFEQHALE